MPACCIVKCGARWDKNQPQMSFHRFPRNESLRKQWLEAIGEENINPRHKNWYLCSLDFEENCFNRTLDVIRLRDNSVPIIFPVSNTKKSSVLCETGNIEKNDLPGMSAVLPSLQLSSQSLHEKVIQDDNVKVFKEKLGKQCLKIKRLNEKIRRKDKKIANLKDILEDLRKKYQINMEQTVLIEELAGPQDVLKRQINKAKGLPTQNKYSEEMQCERVSQRQFLDKLTLIRNE